MSADPTIVPSDPRRSSTAAAHPGTAPSETGVQGGGTIAQQPARPDEVGLLCCNGLDPVCEGSSECARRGWVEVERLRAEVDRWKLLLTVPHAVVPESPEVKPFGEADIADHVYTWEAENGHGFGEYRFETAGDPREFYDWGTGPIVRKRWVLIERTVLP